MNALCPNPAHGSLRPMQVHSAVVTDKGNKRERYVVTYKCACGGRLVLRMPCRFTLKGEVETTEDGE